MLRAESRGSSSDHSTKPSTVHFAKEGPRRRGALASALGLWENNTSRKRGTSTDISEYISYYTAHSRENVIPTTQHAENIKPSSLQTGDVSAARGHHVSEHQEILSPSHCNQMGPTLGVQRPYHLPLPDASFVHFEPTPFSSPSNRNDFHCSSPSSVYPSEGIRSEECLSPPEMASVNRRSREFILSDLAQYCYRSSEGGERMSDHRSTSLTDGDGPPFRNVDTNLQEELAAAGEYGTRDTNTSTDDRSSEDTAADTSTDTMIGSACELMLTKQRAREEWKCVTADRVILEGNFANEVRETSASAVVCNDDGPAKDKIRASHGRFKFGKWMKKTWGRTGGRFFMKETGEKGHL